MTSPEDAVPEIDRFEQKLPPEPDPRYQHRHHSDVPESDVLEQEIPVGDVPALADRPVLDDERIEPLDAADLYGAEEES